MNIYVIYKKSDKSITGFVWDEESRLDLLPFYEDEDYTLSTNTIDWTEEKTVNSTTLIKTFEDVKDTVASKLSVDSSGKVTKA